MRRLIFLPALLACLYLHAGAETFMVSNKGDRGVGTLREALERSAANGSGVTDYIYFSLPSVTEDDRTIVLLSALPQMRSNLVIDGSTQAGTAFGASGAKVKLSLAYEIAGSPAALLLAEKERNISVYGLFIDGTAAYADRQYRGLGFVSCKDIVVGAPGKGNAIENFYYAIYFDSSWLLQNKADFLSENIRVQSNFVGIKVDGVTRSRPNGIWVVDCANITIGGPTHAEGNVVSGRISFSEEFRNANADVSSGAVYVGSNILGLDYTGRNAFSFLSNDLLKQPVMISGYNLRSCMVEKNVVMGQAALNNLNCLVTVRANKFGADITGEPQFRGGWSPYLVLGDCSGGTMVGGSAAEDRNIFTNAFINPANLNSESVGTVMNTGSSKMELLGNEFYCNSGFRSYVISNKDETKLYATITSRTANSVSGTAPAGSRVDLYFSPPRPPLPLGSCDHCEPEHWFAAVTAGAGNTWSYTGTLKDNAAVVASATLNGETSEFTETRFTYTAADLKITPACNGQKGSITGITATNALSYGWYNSAGTLVASTADLLNVEAGKYRLEIGNGFCFANTGFLEVKNVSVVIDDKKLDIRNATCNGADGSITGLGVPSGFSTLSWTDASGKSAGSSIDLLNVRAGQYTLNLTAAGSPCSLVYGPLSVGTVNGPSIEQSGATITPSRCGAAEGSITNITVNGANLSYSWTNEGRQQVATTKDLTGMPGGTYTLKVTDGSDCGTIYSTAIVIPETNGITILANGKQVTGERCQAGNGSIRGITVTGATTYTWLRDDNTIAGSGADLLNVAAGNYRLQAANASGCMKETEVITIPAIPPTVFTLTATVQGSTCGQADGNIATQVSGTQPQAFRWTSLSGSTVGTAASLVNVTAGAYRLYLTDSYGCERLYQEYNVPTTGNAAADYTAERVINDQCNQITGSIAGPQLSGGQPPYVYEWKDQSGLTVGTARLLEHLSAGTYTLTFGDAVVCARQTKTYTVGNTDAVPAAPNVPGIRLCTAGKAIIRVDKPVPGTYRLYNAEGIKIDENRTGFFSVTVAASTSFSVDLAIGTCESARSPVSVSLVNDAVTVRSMMTPNGDGVNDTWQITGLENYSGANVMLYNRNGELVYQSLGYKTPFSGTVKGRELPLGTYYYVIDLKAHCALVSGALTIIR